MSKILVRIVSLLLVLCLVADPSLARGRSWAPSFTPPFDQQALAARPFSCPDPTRLLVILLLTASIIPSLFAQKYSNPDFAQLLKTEGIDVVLEYCDAHPSFETALAHWLETTPPSSLEQRALIRETAIDLFVDTDNPMVASDLMDRLLVRAMEDVDQYPGIAPEEWAGLFYDNLHARQILLITPAKIDLKNEISVDRTLAQVPQSESQRLFLIALLSRADPDLSHDVLPSVLKTPITPKEITVVPKVPIQIGDYQITTEPSEGESWASRVGLGITLLLGLLYFLRGVDFLHTPSQRGLRRDQVLGWAPILQELTRAMVWNLFGLAGAWVISLVFVAVQWLSYRTEARWFYHVGLRSTKELQDGGLRYWLRRKVFIVGTTSGFSIVVLAFAMSLFSLLQAEEDRKGGLWLVAAIVNGLFHFGMGLTWTYFFKIKVRNRDSVVMPASVRGLGSIAHGPRPSMTEYIKNVGKKAAEKWLDSKAIRIHAVFYLLLWVISAASIQYGFVHLGGHISFWSGWVVILAAQVLARVWISELGNLEIRILRIVLCSPIPRQTQEHPFLSVDVEGGTPEQQLTVRSVLRQLTSTRWHDAASLHRIHLQPTESTMKELGKYLGSGEILLYMPQSEQSLASTILHELGHLLHIEDPEFSNRWRKIRPYPLKLKLFRVFIGMPWLIGLAVILWVVGFHRPGSFLSSLNFFMDSILLTVFYAWSKTRIWQKYIRHLFAKGAPFVSLYAMTDFFEDLAVSYQWYALRRRSFRGLLSHHPLLGEKFRTLGEWSRLRDPRQAA